MELSALLADDMPSMSKPTSLSEHFAKNAPSSFGLLYDFLLDDIAETVEDINERFSISDKLLGDGSYSVVYLAHRKSDSLPVAVKTINKKFLFSDKERAAVKTEVELHFRLNHPNIVKLMEVFETDRHIHLVMELCHGGTLDQYTKRLPGRSLPETAARTIFTQLVSAVSHLVEKGIIHGDIKPANILLAQPLLDKENSDLTIKLCDFGMARSVVNKFNMPRGVIGTPGFIAPEVLDGSIYSYPVDMWSCGVSLYVILFGVLPFRNSNDTKLEFPNQPLISQAAQDFIYGLVCAHPGKRLRADQAERHPFLN